MFHWKSIFWLVFIGVVITSYNLRVTLRSPEQGEELTSSYWSYSIASNMASNVATNITKRLVGLEPTIEQLMKIGGTVGVAIGVLYQGDTIYQANFGYRDLEKKLPVSENTIFAGCSLTKAVTAATMGLLVESGQLTWDTRVKDALPAFENQDQIIRNCTTIVDLLSHRTGMDRSDNIFFGTDNNVLISGNDSLKFLNSQGAMLPFRGQFAYQNMGYEVAGHVIDHISGTTWSDLAKTRILDPLGMHQTTLRGPPTGADDVAKAYNVLDDGTPTPIGAVKDGDDGFGGPSGGIKTCLSDLLKLYKAFIISGNDQFATGNTSTKGYPLQQVSQLLSARIFMHPPTRGETSYALGWARVQLPGTMGAVGNNPALMPSGMPTVGKGGPSTLLLYHQGSLPGALSAVNLIPEMETAIVILSNTCALNDVPDWIGQLMVEALLDVPQRNDYVSLARASVAETLKWYPRTYEDLEKGKGTRSPSRSLTEYVGTYWNNIRVFKIEVTESQGVLYWAFQGLESEKWSLEYYDEDVFSWFRSRNELVKRGRWVDQPASFWKAVFKPDDNGRIQKLVWAHDVGVPAMELVRDTGPSI